ncbi:hypothetical protein Bpfe_025074 [Biomphalaria pfeifferi]|uniref:CABIT domain-containing protein n=1 Tax=Biomphalaria pfeifferi TaxID=112525 RepID=A0AAD8EZV2_BIOPF|nr:hypothetical protein Bpfe_025074 [Biomphalaria pfeifferi]
MLRRHKKVKQTQEKKDSSRLSPEVLHNPVNETAHWSQESYSLDGLKEKFQFPQIVRCANKLVPGDSKNLPVNIYVPMLLFTGRTARKILAKHVGVEAKTQRLVETEDSIVIPSDYDGHFLRLASRTTHDKSTVRSLLHIAHSDIPAFVNFSTIVSFPTPPKNPSSSSNLDSTGSQISVKSGPQVLSDKEIVHKPGCVFVVRGVTKGFAKSKRRLHEILLLQCTDESGRDLLIPTDQSGEFVEIQIPPNGDNKLSVLPHQLIAANRYPSLVRFVYGQHAPRLSPTSLMFTLVDTFEEESLIACMLYPNHAMMIELPMTSNLTFQVATNRDEVMELGLPRHASMVLEEKREQFMKDLKLKCKFLHHVSPGMTPTDELASATVRTRQFINESFFYV